MVEAATKVTEHGYKLSFENERIRILEVNLQPGDRTALHIHPAYGFYPLAEGKLIRCITRTGHDNSPSPAPGHSGQTSGESVGRRMRATGKRVRQALVRA